MAYLGMDLPKEPSRDYLTDAVIDVFYFANRGRSYASGMSVMPLPLSVSDISSVAEVHFAWIPRYMLDVCVFALDDIFLENCYQQQEKSS